MSASFQPKRVVVTGGAGFIGSHLVKKLLQAGHAVLTVDALTYAGNLDSLAACADHPEHKFLKADVCDESTISEALSSFQPDWIFHLAAETHVDRSIDGRPVFSKPT